MAKYLYELMCGCLFSWSVVNEGFSEYIRFSVNNLRLRISVILAP